MAKGDTIVPGDLPSVQRRPIRRSRRRRGLGAGSRYGDGARVSGNSPICPTRTPRSRRSRCSSTPTSRRSLRRTGGNVSEAARQAGLDRSNFRRVLKKADFARRPEALRRARCARRSHRAVLLLRPAMRLGGSESDRGGRLGGCSVCRRYGRRSRRRAHAAVSTAPVTRPQRPQATPSATCPKRRRAAPGCGAPPATRARRRRKGIRWRAASSSPRRNHPNIWAARARLSRCARSSTRRISRRSSQLNAFGGLGAGPHRARQQCVQPQHRRVAHRQHGARLAHRHRRAWSRFGPSAR